MNRFVTNFAASTMVIAMTMVGCQADTFLSSASAATAERGEQQAQRIAEQARTAVQNGNLAEALRLAERAVELAPRDAGYRMLLADVYVKNGRFRSAEASYSDVLSIDDGNTRAGLNLALTQIAQGRSGDALVAIEAVEANAPASDVGLAYALAGQTQRAIAVLEPAARASNATGRTRQNLALAYALAGDWQRARTVAAQDVSPAELAPRMQQWAALASPAAQNNAVASLLGVTPVQDAGQPVRLALSQPAAATQAYAQAAPEAPAEAPVQLASNDVFVAAPAAAEEVPAEAEAVPAPAVETIRYAEAPVVVAPQAAAPAPVTAAAEQSGSWWPAEGNAAPAPAPAPVEAPAPVRYAAVARDEAPAPAAVAAILSAPSPVLARSVAPARTSRPVFRPAAVNRAASISAHFPRPGSGTGNFVVQLGAFANPGNAERAWNAAQQRFGLSQAQARTASVTMGGRTLTRVSVAGFANRADAARLCSALQSQGGSCFVRGVAGDAPVRWASRSTTARRG